jgi:hypothetical protein
MKFVLTIRLVINTTDRIQSPSQSPLSHERHGQSVPILFIAVRIKRRLAIAGVRHQASVWQAIPCDPIRNPGSHVKNNEQKFFASFYQKRSASLAFFKIPPRIVTLSLCLTA